MKGPYSSQKLKLDLWYNLNHNTGTVLYFWTFKDNFGAGLTDTGDAPKNLQQGTLQCPIQHLKLSIHQR